MNPAIVVIIGFAVLLHRLAAHEHMTAWAWAVASVGLSFLVMQLVVGMAPIIMAQLLLFGTMWWQNVKRRDAMLTRQMEERARDERLREKLLRRGRAVRERERAAAAEGPAGSTDDGAPDVSTTS